MASNANMIAIVTTAFMNVRFIKRVFLVEKCCEYRGLTCRHF